MPLPNFLVIGAMKAGTTSLHKYLDSHPQVFMSRTKELNFFVENMEWTQGWGWYEQQFAGADGRDAVGESSPSYSEYPMRQGVVARIAAALPNVRLIYLLRNPVERARSEHLHRSLRGFERQSLERAVFANPRYLTKSMYAFQLEQYLEYFSLEQVLLITSEQLMDKREETLRLVFRFLGVDPNWTPSEIDKEFHKTAEMRIRRSFGERIRHIPGYETLATLAPLPAKKLNYRLTTRGFRPSRSEMTGPLRGQLEEILRSDVRRLRQYIGPHFDGWGIA